VFIFADEKSRQTSIARIYAGGDIVRGPATAVEAVADRLGIGRHLDKVPVQLSVGERQRVAIARAMAHEPSVVIADEPTASLDPINAEEIMGLFSNLVDEFNVTLVVGTHDWDRVEERGFRRVKFELEKDAADGTVRATVSA